MIIDNIYQITGGLVWDKYQQLIKTRVSRKRKAVRLAKKFGGLDTLISTSMHGDVITQGVRFKKHPGVEWAKVIGYRGFFRPKKTSSLWAEWSALQTPTMFLQEITDILKAPRIVICKKTNRASMTRVAYDLNKKAYFLIVPELSYGKKFRPRVKGLRKIDLRKYSKLMGDC